MANAEGHTRNGRAVSDCPSTGSGAVSSTNAVQVVVIGVVLVGDAAIDSLQDGTLRQVVLVTQNVVVSTFLVGIVTLDITSMTPLSQNSTIADIELAGQIPNVLMQVVTRGQIQTSTVKQNANLAKSSLVHDASTVIVQLTVAISQAIISRRAVTSSLDSSVSIASIKTSDSVVQTQSIGMVTLLGVVGGHVFVPHQSTSAVCIGQASRVADNSVKASNSRGNVSDCVIDTLIKSTSTRTAAQLTEQCGVSTDTGSAGVNVELGAQSTGRASQVTGDHGTKTARQTDEGVTVVPHASGTVFGVQAVFELEDSLQAVAQIFNTLETDVGGVRGNAVTIVEIGSRTGGRVGSLDAVEGSVSNTVDGDVGLSESGGRSQSSNSQSDNLLIQPRVSSKENDNFPLYFNMFAQNNHPIRFRKIGIKGDYLLNFLH